MNYLFGALVRSKNALFEELDRDRDEQINMENLEKQDYWETKFKNLTSAFNKNQHELLQARKEITRLQNFQQILEKQYSKQSNTEYKEKDTKYGEEEEISSENYNNFENNEEEKKICTKDTNPNKKEVLVSAKKREEPQKKDDSEKIALREKVQKLEKKLKEKADLDMLIE